MLCVNNTATVTQSENVQILSGMPIWHTSYTAFWK